MPALPPEVQRLLAVAERVAREAALPYRDEVDRDSRWPAEAMRALAEAGLLGLHVPRHLGGHGEGLTALVAVCEALGRVCPAAALCFGMHCVATAVIAAKATRWQQEHYLRAIARGEHFTTLALSEGGSGSHFYLPETRLIPAGEHYLIKGEKRFVTSGGHADSYVVSTVAAGPGGSPGQFSCVLVDRDLPGMTWGEPWAGFGMRGNESRTLRLDRVRVSREHLLGEEGDQVWYVFEVVTPYFLMGMSGVYLGIGQAVLELVQEHLGSRRYTHSGERLADVSLLQHRLAEQWIALNRSRTLVYEAARLAEVGDPGALAWILASKADVADMVVQTANEGMTLCGGAAYAQNGPLARFLRDARAAHVMAPTTDILKTWTGRVLLGQPLL